MQIREDHRQAIGQAAGFQNRVERATRANNQQNISNRSEAVFSMGQQDAHPHLATNTKNVISDKNGNKHRGDRVADKFQQHIQRAAFSHVQFSDGFHQHQPNR